MIQPQVDTDTDLHTGAYTDTDTGAFSGLYTDAHTVHLQSRPGIFNARI
jgi:hypothetical protein